jgi:cytochrome c-type biogenesis protein CcmE
VALKAKHRRLVMVLAGLALLGVAAAFVGSALRDNLVFFFTPSEALEKNIPPERRFRLGGLVEEGSLERKGASITFRITDSAKTLPVAYTGVLPDLFREGQGVVAEGRLKDGIFQAQTVLAKHDETYMPKEVAEGLKKAGHWKGGQE